MRFDEVEYAAGDRRRAALTDTVAALPLGGTWGGRLGDLSVSPA